MRRIKIDPKSIDFKLWTYFVIFALLLMAVLWVFQFFFLNIYYQGMKISETRKVALTIGKQYGGDDFIEKIRELSITNDMYIHIETADGSIIFSPSTEEKRRPSYAYISEMGRVKAQLIRSSEAHVSVIIPDSRTDTNTLAYAAYLNDTPGSRVILYIFSPLYPVSSTIAILHKQLIYVTAIAMILAFSISFYISRRITKPIREITNSAKSLAEGNYGVSFDGGSYTEITNLADTLTYAGMRLAKTDTLQKDLMANVSHDLKTPLTMVKSYAEMIRDISGNSEEKRNAHLSVIIEEADRLNLLVNDMLTLSRVQSGAVQLQKSSFDMNTVASNILQSYALYCEREGYTLTLICDDAVTVTADPAKIEQVLSNLMQNAIKYCGLDKLVILSVKHKNEKVRCEITDHGMGIPQSEIGQIWERYYKASTNHIRSTSGTGLGLAIVKEILTLHNAAFGVISEPGQGSTFWFEL